MFLDIIRNIKCIGLIGIIVVLLFFFGFLGASNSSDDTTKEPDKKDLQIEMLISENNKLINELKELKDQNIKINTQLQNKTEIAYVEKESQNDADIEINKTPPKVIINAGDDDKFEFTPELESFSTIENGKMVINEKHTLELNIEKIVEEKYAEKLEAINATHELELAKKNEELDKANRVLKRTRKQRDVYATAFGVTAGGMGFVQLTKSF